MKLLLNIIFYPILWILLLTIIIANWFYQGEKFAEAKTLLNPAFSIGIDYQCMVKINLAKTHYQLEEYSNAYTIYQQLLNEDCYLLDNKISEMINYDLGNTLYRLGEKKIDSNIEETIRNWKSAIKSYEKALKINKNNSDAEENIEFIKRKLAELEKKNQDKNPTDSKTDPAEISKENAEKEKENRDNYEKGREYSDYSDNPPPEYDKPNW